MSEQGPIAVSPGRSLIRVIPLAAAVLAASCGLWGSRAAADEGDYLTEEDVLFDIPVASGASRFPQALNKAPASVIIIDRAMIEASGAMEVPDLFRLIPGFQVYSPAYSHPVMNYHTQPDSFPSRLEVRIDGRSAYEPFTNTVFWIVQGLEVEDIDYIEVVRGSNIPAHGANAINGSINIVTRSPLETTGFTARAEAGSNDTRNLSASYGDTLDNLSFRVSGRYRSNEGFPRFEGEQVDDDSEALSLGLKLLWVPTLDDTISLQLGHTDSEFTFDQGNTNVDPSELFEWEVDLTFLNLDWRHQWNDQHSLNLLLSHNRTDIDAIESIQLVSELIGFPPELVFPGVEDFEVVLGIDEGYSERSDLELSHTGGFGSNFKFDWGAAARRDAAKSQLHFSSDREVTETFYRLFGNAEYSAADWFTFNFGASLGHSDTIGSHPSWRLSGNFHINPDHTLRVAANRATRAPSVLQAHYYRTLHDGDTIYDLDVIADPDIQEEERESLELGYYGHFNDGRLTLDLKLFIEENEQLIDIQVDRDYQGPMSVDNEVTYSTNSLMSDDQGFEAYLRWQPAPSWLLISQYTHLSVDAEHLRRINPLRISDRDDAAAKNTFSLLVDYDFGHGFKGAASYYYQSDVDWKNAPPTDSYDRLDFNIRKEFDIARLRGRVELLAQNVFGSEYVDYRYFQEVDTRYYLRLVTEF